MNEKDKMLLQSIERLIEQLSDENDKIDLLFVINNIKEEKNEKRI